MGIEVDILKEGDGKTSPAEGDTVRIGYTGWVEDLSQSDRKGFQFDTTKGRGDFETSIGMNKVIQGLEMAIPKMTLGEESTIWISSDHAYEKGWPDLIPEKSNIIFQVKLKGVNRKGTSIWIIPSNDKDE